jgi:hypothetical protein
MLMLEAYKEQLSELDGFFSKVKSLDVSNTVKKAIRDGIRKHYRELSDEIYKLENRESTKLKTREIDGNMVEIPRCLNYEENKYDFKYIDNVLYVTNKNKYNKDGSFHFWTYVWFKNGNKYTKATVSILGGDNYGDRIYCGTDHYKDKRDSYPYSNRNRVDCTRGLYKEYVNKVIQLVRQEEGFENFFDKGRFI